jgi:DNA repair exonuclease SbcCD ATPase subunit
MRITAVQRTANKNQIRAAIDRLLRGEIPPGGRCDVKTLAAQAGVDRTAFYGNRPYAHLRAEFEQRLQAIQTAGERPDPRDAQITRLKNELTALRQRLTESASTIDELTEFRTQALAQLAAQHDEITRLRASATAASRIRRLPQRAATIGSCS